MFSDRAKLLLLVASTALFLGTLLTSPSTTTNNPNMRVLVAPVRQFCKAPREAATACSKRGEHQTECARLTQSVQTCDRVLKGAFRDINLGGCPFQIKAVTLCEDEWCRHDPKSCLEECSSVKAFLASCIQRHVASYFQRNGLKEDGTPN